MHHTHKPPFIEELTAITGQDPSQCYQCGKCSAGCPVREFTDEAPNRVVRYVQLGFYEKALTSKTLWLCAGCQTCSSRCPKDFHLAHFMDAMRELALKKGMVEDEKNTVEFHKAFLKQIESYGRTHEVGMVRDYKLHTMDLMKDVDLAPTMFLKGKLSILPHKVKDTKTIKKIFKQK
ncbi:MAG: 4Fe-4S dicluster domain-containing protein [Ignavibacteria bacterium]|nr:4Fe-4S dicluster domain-containing protein [Ignavibacteria bacterium]